MAKELIGGSVGTALSAIGTAFQTSEVLQIISLVITIVGGLITFIIIPLYNWYKNAKSDNKITMEELDDAKNIIVSGSKEVSNLTKEKKKDE